MRRDNDIDGDMPLISVTRLQIRSARFMPLFLVYTFRSMRQVTRSTGFIQGWTANEWPWGFWTVTSWSDVDAMRAYRNSEPHLTAMRKLLHWCDEASYTHWQQDGPEPPAPQDAYRRVRDEGKVSKVKYPSARQAAGRTTGAAAPTRGPTLRPKR